MFWYAMNDQSECCICHKKLPLGCQICAACESSYEFQGQIIRLPALQTTPLICSMQLSQHLLALHHKYFSDPEVQKAYQIDRAKLCDEPSQSDTPLKHRR